MEQIEVIDSIIERYNHDGGALISILQDIQAEYNYLPQDVLAHVAQKLKIPLVDVYGVATFYRSFRLKPRGKYLLTVCLGTACHVRGAPRILAELKRRLNIQVDETTRDNLFTLETVNCLGACALGPVLVTNGDYHGQMTKAKVDLLLQEYVESERLEKNRKPRATKRNQRSQSQGPASRQALHHRV